MSLPAEHTDATNNRRVSVILNQAVRARRPVAESSGCRLAGRRIRPIGALVASDHCRRRAQLDAPSTRRSVTLSVAAPTPRVMGRVLALRVRRAGDRGFALLSQDRKAAAGGYADTSHSAESAESGTAEIPPVSKAIVAPG